VSAAAWSRMRSNKPSDPPTRDPRFGATAAAGSLHAAPERTRKTSPTSARTPNLRGRLERLLQPSETSARLQLAGRVRRIAMEAFWLGIRIASIFSFELLQEKYRCERRWSGCTCARPHSSAISAGNPYPRIVGRTSRVSVRADWAYGPFASRTAAERFSEEALKLFLLRRCTDDLDPNPSHPGCVYSEMKMCLAPCYKGCTDQRYGEESAAVRDFLATRGESKLVTLRTQREQASANLEFESRRRCMRRCKK